MKAFTCPDCRKHIPATKKRRPRLRCKKCARAEKKKTSAAAGRLWELNHPEEARARLREFYVSHRQNNAEWREENKRRAKAWRKKNREYVQEYSRARYRMAVRTRSRTADTFPHFVQQ